MRAFIIYSAVAGAGAGGAGAGGAGSSRNKAPAEPPELMYESIFKEPRSRLEPAEVDGLSTYGKQNEIPNREIMRQRIRTCS